MLLLALALAGQPMGHPAAIEGGHLVIGPTRAFADQERAALACTATNGVWRCDPELLRAFNAEDTTTIDAPAGVSVSVKLVVGPRQNTGASAGSSQRCVTAVHVDVTATPEPVVVDWGGATLTVDG